MSHPQGEGNQPRIRFEAIGGAWALYQQQMGMWILISLVIVLIGVAINSVLEILLGRAPTGLSPFSMFLAPSRLLLNFIESTISYTLVGAALHAAIRHVRGEGVRLEYLTEVVPIGGKLIITSLIVGVATTIAMIFCILPAVVVGGLLMFAIPLVVDKKAEPLDAVRQSFEMLKSQWLMATLFYFVATLVGIVGVILCGVGLILTLPMFLLSVALLYDDFVRGAAEP